MLTHDPCDAAIATSHAFTGHHAAGGDVRVVTSGKRIRCAINKELFFRNRVVVDNEQSQEPRQVIDDMYQSD